jgi:hypothetical protein
MNLKMTKSEVRERGNVCDGFEERLEAAKEEAANAELEADEAEIDLLAADEESAEGLVADKRHHEACGRLRRAEADAAKVAGALKLARRELKTARKHLAAARDDMEAIRAGRRKR